MIKYSLAAGKETTLKESITGDIIKAVMTE